MTGSAYTAPPRVLGLVADDLTGAADCAVGFAEHGWRVELALRSAAPRMLNPSIATVLALTTESRALPDTNAAQQTFTAANELITAGAERLYIKIDSTVRGSVGGGPPARVRHSDVEDNLVIRVEITAVHSRSALSGACAEDWVEGRGKVRSDGQAASLPGQR